MKSKRDVSIKIGVLRSGPELKIIEFLLSTIETRL